ncbi:hypothetical protein QFC21_005433 [Naganishia friedmannii]|uniref:Uncharacterized protein n=1 Tax=Naganishia friedmannii TaxID=89922 RepID=A0ACC2V9L2_9TREE|nr:hypothetical protein QFC21_005433 [Naganishia friedmannii]
MSTTSSKLSSSSGSSAAGVRSKSPSYLRHTVASRGKMTEKASTMKVINEWREAREEKERERKRQMARNKKTGPVARTARYLKSTKTAAAKMAVRKYVMQGVTVEVPQIALMEFKDSEEDVEAYAELQWAQGHHCTDDLFSGRHTYRDAEGNVVLRREDWKEQMWAQHGVDVDEARRCRVLGEEYDYQEA